VYFSPQPLATAAHHNVGQVAIPNVPVNRSFTNVQFLCRFLNGEQSFIIIRSLQFRCPLRW
jgi:hypothetical protein